MERLTKRNEADTAYYYPKCFEKCDGFGASEKCNNCVLVHDVCEKLGEYEDLEEQGLLLKLPCKVGDTVYVDSSALPIEDMECYEDVDNPIPSYFTARVVSFRFAKRNFMKIAVKAKWLYEWVDEETGPDSKYVDCEKNFSFPLSAIGKTIFITQEKTEEKLKESGG